MAIVLVIVALLTSGMLISLSAQQNVQAIRDTQARLANIQEALLGFAAANGRLPCPAAPATTGLEAPLGGGPCSNPYDGFVPAVTLGIAPVDAKGYVLDAWGQPIRYTISRDPTSDMMNSNAGGPWNESFTTTDRMRSIGLPSLHPDLQVCSKGPPKATFECPDGFVLSNSAVAVIYSTGPNGVTGGSVGDEAENPNPNSAVAADRVFVSHTQTAAGSANGEFDDIVVWLSPNILYNRMIAAGRLP